MQKSGYFKKRRFYCPNETGCDRAINFIWNTEKEAKDSKGLCPNCKTALIERGALPPSKSKWAITLIVCAAIILSGYQYYLINKPYASNSIAIKNQNTYVQAGTSTVPVTIEWAGELQGKIHLKYHTSDGTALAGIDYAASNDTVTFDAAGEKSKTIQIALLGNKDFVQNAKTFSVIFTNVENTPEAKIIIQPIVADKTSISAAEALVSSLSITAENIGRFQKRHHYLMNFISKLKNNDIASQMIDQYKINESNLIGQREKYYGLLKDLSQVEYHASIIALDNRIESLEKLGNTIQRNATLRMKEHFIQFTKTGIVEMNLWAEQLGEVIPSTKEKNQDSSEFKF